VTVTEDWQTAWQPVIEAVGTDFGGGEVVEGADAVDASALRRFLEPLELDCPLHHDERVAREHGYPGVNAPISSYFTFVAPPIWRPGDPPVFTSDERDAQPEGIAARRFLTASSRRTRATSPRIWKSSLCYRWCSATVSREAA
jgi:hypothetical protein